MKGKCNCGAVRFEIKANIRKLYQCHCKLCQRQSGSTSNTATMVNASDFKWISGADDITHWKKSSGFTAHFCRTCGCPVPNRLRETEYYWIPMGLVENTDARIVAHLCYDSRAEWDTVPSDELIYTDLPENLDGFIASLHSTDS